MLSCRSLFEEGEDQGGHLLCHNYIRVHVHVLWILFPVKAHGLASINSDHSLSDGEERDKPGTYLGVCYMTACLRTCSSVHSQLFTVSMLHNFCVEVIFLHCLQSSRVLVKTTGLVE